MDTNTESSRGTDVQNLENYLAELVRAGLEERTPIDLPDTVEADYIVEIARKNHMEYLLLGGLIRTNISDETKAQIRPLIKNSMMRTMIQINELKELEKRFEEAGVINQPMKGAYLKFIYPQPMIREMSDIDVLIGAGCMEKAADILKDMGYQLHQAVKHHDIYQKPPFMVVEAHRAMYDKTVDKKQYEYFSDFSKAVLKEGCSYTYNFKPEDFYVYMMAHMAKHFYKKGCGIRNIMDVYVYRKYYEGKLDENYIDDELNKCGIYHFTKHMEKLCRVWLLGEEGNEFYDHLFSYMLDSGIYGKDENGIWNEFAREKNESELHYKFKLKKFYYFPPYHYMEMYFPWLRGRKFLLPAAWITRAVRGVVKKRGKDKRQMIHNIDQKDIRIFQSIYQEMQFKFHE